MRQKFEVLDLTEEAAAEPKELNPTNGALMDMAMGPKPPVTNWADDKGI